MCNGKCKACKQKRDDSQSVRTSIITLESNERTEVYDNRSKERDNGNGVQE